MCVEYYTRRSVSTSYVSTSYVACQSAVEYCTVQMCTVQKRKSFNDLTYQDPQFLLTKSSKDMRRISERLHLRRVCACYNRSYATYVRMTAYCRICETTVRISLLNTCITTQVMIMVLGARRARCRQTRCQRGGVCTLMVDTPLLQLMIVGRCKGNHLITQYAAYTSCKNDPSTCTYLDLASSSYPGQYPPSWARAPPWHYFCKCPPTFSNNDHIIAPHVSAQFVMFVESPRWDGIYWW
jgi:hypothetical protein